MKQAKLNSGVFLLVEVGDWKGLFFIDKRHVNFLCWKEQVSLPPGQWEIIGKGNEITEEVWREIVDKVRAEWLPMKFKDYKNGSPHFCDTPTESGHSLIKSHGMKPEQCVLLKLKNNENTD